MQEITKLTGREYHFTYHGAADAENIIVAMGSITDLLIEQQITLTIQVKLALLQYTIQTIF